MNILFLDQFSTLGGAQQCLRDLLPGVLARGWTAHAGIPAGGPLEVQLAAAGAITHEIPLGAYTNGRKSVTDLLRFAGDTPRLAGVIRRLISEHEIDVVYVNGPRLLPAAALASGRLVFHSHSLLTPGFAALLAGNSLGRRGASAIASSRFVARPLQPYLPAERVQIVYNGVSDHGPPQPSPHSPVTVGIVGRTAPEKGHADFVSAARILLHDMPDLRFMVCGDPLHSSSDYLEKVREQARGLPIEFRGWQPDIGPVLRTLDVLAVPSTALDATPRVVLEAFSAGVPVVAYPSGGIPELIENGRTGILTAASTPESLAAGIRELLSNRERMSALRENARQAYITRFTLERFRQEVLAILERI